MKGYVIIRSIIAGTETKLSESETYSLLPYPNVLKTQVPLVYVVWFLWINKYSGKENTSLPHLKHTVNNRYPHRRLLQTYILFETLK